MKFRLPKSLGLRLRRTSPLLLGLAISAWLIATGEDEDDIGFSFDSPLASPPSITLLPQNHTLAILAQGKVRAAQHTRLKSEVNGQVIKVSPHLVNGSPVNKGDLLLQIDDREYRWKLAQAEQQLDQAKLSLLEEQALKEQAAEDLADLPPEAQTELARREPYLQMAFSRLNSAKANLELARRDLAKTRIVAPYDGFVLKRSVSLGDFVLPGDELFELYDRCRLLIDTLLSKSQVAQLHTESVTHGSDKQTNEPSVSALVFQKWGEQTIEVPASLLEWGAALDPVSKMQPVTFEMAFQPQLRGLAIKPGSVVTVNIKYGELVNVYRLEKRFVSPNHKITMLNDDGSTESLEIEILHSSLSHSYFRLPGQNNATRAAQINALLTPRRGQGTSLPSSRQQGQPADPSIGKTDQGVANVF